jgi:hypothetical protein
MTPLWEALTALDIPLYVHPRASHKAVMFEGHPDGYIIEVGQSTDLTYGWRSAGWSVFMEIS